MKSNFVGPHSSGDGALKILFFALFALMAGWGVHDESILLAVLRKSGRKGEIRERMGPTRIAIQKYYTALRSPIFYRRWQNE